MNLQKLRENGPALIAHMKKSGYSAGYIRKLELEIEYILSNAESKGWCSYHDVYKYYVQHPGLSKNMYVKHAQLGLLENYDIHGHYPDGKPLPDRARRGKYHLLTAKYKALIDYYQVAETERGIKNSTIYASSHNATGLLYELQLSGITSLSEITEESILSAFITPEGILRRGSSFRKNVLAVLKANIPQNPVECNRVIAFFPDLRTNRKNIPYLSSEESDAIRQTLSDSSAPLSLRDRAIGALAFYTGLRSCDITGLTLSSFDWEHDTIFVNQKKTNKALSLPLTAVVGNVVYDYLVEERPKVDLEHVFLTERGPIRPLADVRHVSNVVMKAAGIRQDKGARRGFHIFRHRVATKLLENDIPRPVISRILGHDSPESLEVYLSADFKHLKQCALNVARFPVAEGVLNVNA